jgi:putative transposase
VAMDGEHALNALRYVLLNPVRAKLCAKPEQWDWSSAKAYLKGRDDSLTDTKDMKAICPDMKLLLATSPEQDMAEMLLRRAETIGRPLGSLAFMDKLERKLGRPLKAAKRGPKSAAKTS